MNTSMRSNRAIDQPKMVYIFNNSNSAWFGTFIEQLLAVWHFVGFNIENPNSKLVSFMVLNNSFRHVLCAYVLNECYNGMSMKYYYFRLQNDSTVWMFSWLYSRPNRTIFIHRNYGFNGSKNQLENINFFPVEDTISFTFETYHIVILAAN